MTDIVEVLKEQLRKGYELGSGAICLVAASDVENFIAEVERLRGSNAELSQALRNLTDMVEAAWKHNKHLFDNGVVSEAGQDEGDTIAGQYLDEARAAMTKRWLGYEEVDGDA